MRISVAGVGLAMVLAASQVFASVDTSPKPGGVYRLKPGLYVRKGVACGSPPNAAILHYDGRGLSGAHSRGCQARVLSHAGQRFTVVQSCTGAGRGAKPSSERQVVAVHDALTFSLSAVHTTAIYRYCPSYMLPNDLRSVVQ